MTVIFAAPQQVESSYDELVRLAAVLAGPTDAVSLVDGAIRDLSRRGRRGRPGRRGRRSADVDLLTEVRRAVVARSRPVVKSDGPGSGRPDGFEALPTLQREVVALRYLAGLSPEEAARVLRVDVPAVRRAVTGAARALAGPDRPAAAAPDDLRVDAVLRAAVLDAEAARARR